jgi:hypothetical protein
MHFLEILGSGLAYYKTLRQSSIVKKLTTELQKVYDETVDEQNQELSAQNTLAVLDAIDTDYIRTPNPLLSHSLDLLRIIAKATIKELSQDEYKQQMLNMINFNLDETRNSAAKKYLENMYYYLETNIALTSREQRLVNENTSLKAELHRTQINSRILQDKLLTKEFEIHNISKRDIQSTSENVELKIFINTMLTQLYGIFKLPFTAVATDNSINKYRQRQNNLMNHIKAQINNEAPIPNVPFFSASSARPK